MKWNNIFQGLIEKNCQLRILYRVKAFRNEREIETLLNKGKLGLSLADRPALREWLKEAILEYQEERKNSGKSKNMRHRREKRLNDNCTICKTNAQGDQWTLG